MDKSIEEKFEEVFQGLAKKDKKKSEEANEKIKRQAAINEEFIKITGEVIEPAMLEIKEYLKGKSYFAKIDKNSMPRNDRSIKFEIATVPNPYDHKDRVPYLWIASSSNLGSVLIRQSTISKTRGGNSGGSKAVKIEEVTRSFVQNAILDIFKAAYG